MCGLGRSLVTALGLLATVPGLAQPTFGREEKQPAPPPLVAPTSLTDANLPYEDKYRNAYWAVHLGGLQHNLRSGDGTELRGGSLTFDIGRGYLHENWYVEVDFGLLLGPYQKTGPQKLDMEYSGTSVGVTWGYSAETANLRSPTGNYGFMLGFQYADITGRSSGERSLTTGSDARVELLSRYRVSIQYASLMPAIFFCWLEEPRLKGNKPELLVTRIEGYMLTLGIGMPLYATYSSSYNRLIETPRSPETTSKEEKAKGGLRGYSIVLSFSTLLGV